MSEQAATKPKPTKVPAVSTARAGRSGEPVPFIRFGGPKGVTVERISEKKALAESAKCRAELNKKLAGEAPGDGGSDEKDSTNTVDQNSGNTGGS